MANRTTRILPGLLAMALSLAAAAEEHSLDVEVGIIIPELDCVIEPSEIVDVGSAVPGVVEIIHAYRSDPVKKGVVVAELESSVEQASVELTKARANRDTAIKLRQQSAILGHLTQKRNQKLLKNSAISVQDMDQLKTETRIAELQVNQERENKHIAGLEYLRAQAVLRQRTIRSPVDGVVMERFKSVGEYVEDEPLLRVAQLNPLHVEVIVPIDYLGRIVRGMQADVMSVVPGSEAVRATVERVDRVADAASGTYGVRLSLPNPEYKIPAGLRCRLGFLPPREKTGEEIAGETVSPVVAMSVNEPAPETPGIAREANETVRKTNEIVRETNTIVRGANQIVTENPKLVTEMPEMAAEAQEMAVETLKNVVEEPQTVSDDQLRSCYSVGPLTDETLARALSDRLAAQFSDLVLRNEVVSLENRYLVLATPETGRRETKELLARLRSAGISDLYVLRHGSFKGRVSLGLYNRRNSAIKWQRKLAAKGFQTEVLPFPKNTTQYWLDGSLNAGLNLPGDLQKISHFLPPSAAVAPAACSEQLAHR